MVVLPYGTLSGTCAANAKNEHQEQEQEVPIDRAI